MPVSRHLECRQLDAVLGAHHVDAVAQVLHRLHGIVASKPAFVGSDREGNNSFYCVERVVTQHEASMGRDRAFFLASGFASSRCTLTPPGSIKVVPKLGCW